jgi:cell division protein FtsW
MSTTTPDLFSQPAVRGQAARVRQGRRPERRVPVTLDYPLITVTLLLAAIGLVMMSSASISIAERLYGQPLFFMYRQGVYLLIGMAMAIAVVRLPMAIWERTSGWLFIFSIALLVLVLIPGIGREVNGSMRWLYLAGFTMQPSEVVKLATVIYVAGYLVRRGEEVRTSAIGFLKPMVLLGVISVLLLLEPDFGAAAILTATVLGMMFLGGVRLWQYALLILVAGALLALLALSSPYRLQRITTFLNPWDDPFNRGFQLTQALIAFGRGEWFGVGLGNSVQKLFYLPEAHTDFVYAVLAEELGLAGAILVLALFVYLVWRAFIIAMQAEEAGKSFNAYVAYGIGLWIGLQVFINLGVNMGLLPTKGLTLPLMSYGGSSILVMCLCIALLVRVDRESRLSGYGGAR